MKPLLRALGPNDIRQCAAMVVDSVLGQPYGFTLEGMTATLSAALHAGQDLVVAEDAEGPAGFAWIDPRGAFSAPYLRLLAVADRARWAGVGGALLEEFERRTATVGRDYCLLVSEFNESARLFYARHDYEICGCLDDFARPGIKEILMVKHRIAR